LVKDLPSAVPLGLRASMWAGPTALMAQAELEANVVPAAVEGDKDLADPVEAAEQSLEEGVAGLAAVQEAARAVEAHLAAEAADVFFASK
jgi:hypothetical protein